MSPFDFERSLKKALFGDYRGILFDEQLLDDKNLDAYFDETLTEGLTPVLQIISNNFKNRNSNKSINELVLKRQTFKPFIKNNNKIIRKIEPIYYVPGSKFGRSHFFASEKKLGSLTINTVSFNIVVLWFMTLIFCIFLITLFYKKF